MVKTSFLFLVVCAMCVVDQSVGNNFYWPSYPNSQDLLNYPQIVPFSPFMQPDCDKSKKSSESESSESSESGESGSSEKSKESEEESGSKEESNESKESKSKSEESKGSKSNSEESKESKNSSKEKSKKGSGEDSSEESEEKKKEGSKKKSGRTLFPPRTYPFPARQMQHIMYSPVAPYTFEPYRASFVVQQPFASYPARTNYQYVSVPTVAKSYSAPQVVNRMAQSPITRIIYSTSALNYPAVPKTVVAPGPRVYAAPVSWNSPSGSVSYYRI